MVEMNRAAVAVMLLFAPGMAAALSDCAALGGASDAYKVVMDELALPVDAGAATSKLQELKNRLAFTLSVQLQEFQSDVVSKKITPSIGLGLVNCINRMPSPGGLEFDAQRVRTLNDQRVVVELWGNLLASGENPAGTPHAQIGYVIPPMLHYLPGQAMLGRFSVQYPKNDGDVSGTLRLPEATAFALVGLGLKAFKANKYDLATWAFGRSEASIKQAQDFGGTAELGMLLDYVKLAACEVREKARDDSAHYAGPISLTPREHCGMSP
jgi:hypothetical protein